MVGVAPAAKQKALCVATRCTSAQQFIETFHRFCDEQSFFVATVNMRAVGLETPFSIQLSDKTPVLRGLCVVLAAYTTAANPYKRPGIRLGIRRLTPESETVFYQLQAMRTATPQEVADEASEATEVPMPPVPVKLPPIPTAPRLSPPAIPRGSTAIPVQRQPTPRVGSVLTVPPRTTPSQPIKVIPPPEPELKPELPKREPIAEQVVAQVIGPQAVAAVAAKPEPPNHEPPKREAIVEEVVVAQVVAAQAVAAAKPEPPKPEPPRPAPPRPAPPRPGRIVEQVVEQVVLAPAVERVAVPVVADQPAADQRTPGSDFVLPANPLSHLSDDAIVGFVDCTLYEETANFFRADAADDFEPEDPVAAPPPPPAAPIDALPVFNPNSVIENAFPDVDASGPTNVRHTGPMPPLDRPLPPHSESESSMKAAITRVEHSVAMILTSLDKGDTSRPIDELRPTPLPAGEAYARQVAEARTTHARSKWIVIGSAVATIAVAIVVIAATRGGGDAKPEPVDKPAIVASKGTAPADPIDKPVTDVPKVDVDSDEIEATSEKVPGTPVVGAGPCKFDVTTTPAGTMVKVDGDTVGPSPVTIAGPCVKRRVDLVHPRYKVEQRWVAPTADKPSAIDVTLVRPTHNLLVTSNPTGATVFIAGRRAGTTPTKVPLMGFSGIDVKLEKKGFETVSKRIYSKVAEDKLSVSLKRSLVIK